MGWNGVRCEFGPKWDLYPNNMESLISGLEPNGLTTTLSWRKFVVLIQCQSFFWSMVFMRRGTLRVKGYVIDELLFLDWCSNERSEQSKRFSV